MRESNASISLVFYIVKPCEVRWTQLKNEGFVQALRKLGWTPGKNRGYAQALQKLKNKRTYHQQSQSQEKKLQYDSNTFESWRFALSSVADMVGFELEACNGF